MKLPELSQFQTTSMTKQNGRDKSSSLLSDGFLFVGGAMVALLFVWALGSFISPSPDPNHSFSTGVTESKPRVASENVNVSPPKYAVDAHGSNLHYDPPERTFYDPPERTFYDDPKLSYTIGEPIRNWDEKRKEWLKHHQSFAAGADERVLMVSGSQPSPCRNPIGDNLLLRFFKNKVDYCRIHGYDIFYNNVLLQPKMFSYWAKIPVVRAAMVAHPEAEWIWWVDSDAAFTDMDFKLPLDRYRNHNLVVHGWSHLIYDKKSWTSINAGVLLIRNCQWSLDFMEVWASMGPQTPKYDRWGKILRSTLNDKMFPESDDQSGLVYLLLKERDKWGDKVYLEGEYYFEGYWLEIVGTLENITDKYATIEKGVRRLRRRHAEKVSESYGAQWEEYLKDAGNGKGSWRRPFITHFTGCQPCSGDHNQMYSGHSCWEAMKMALNFADNQVLRNYGFMHQGLLDSSSVSPLPFDFPA
ncbi:unnamed protein product [Ilex paraguariensis]|uniref:Glycosyltransferase 7 n=1 Tax=Ilex paraguariensis TaxID=185542 RepID=A0ABC8SEE6_9AQUA